MKETTVSLAPAVLASEAVLPVRVQEAKSAVSRQFVARTRENLEALM